MGSWPTQVGTAHQHASPMPGTWGCLPGVQGVTLGAAFIKDPVSTSLAQEATPKRLGRAVLVESHRFPKAHTLAHKPFRPCLRPSAPPHHDSWGLGRLAQPLTVCIGDRPNSSPGTPRDLPAARCFHTCSFSLKSSNEQHRANSRTDPRGRHFVLLFIPITPIHPQALPLPHFQRGEWRPVRL